MMLLLLFIGDKLSISDCLGTFQRSRLKETKDVFLIAAGTGKKTMMFINITFSQF